MNTSFERKDKKEDWITPPKILEELGKFDLDPCSSEFQEVMYAKENYNIANDGLNKDWFGCVWCNPPYGVKTRSFIEKMAKHGNGIALIFSRMDTKLWQEVIFKQADAIFMIKGRLKFWKFDEETNKLIEGDSAGVGSCLVAFGKENVDAIANTSFEGEFLFTHQMINKLNNRKKE